MSLWIDFLGASVTWVEAGGVPTRVVVAGEGEPPIVLIHGRGGHLESWRANLMPLARERRTIAFDLLGHGLTRRHAGDYCVSTLADHAAATLERLDVRDAVIVGQSIGGWIAALLALRRPELARSLVLVEPAGLQTADEQAADPGAAARLAQGGRAFDEPSSESVRQRFNMLVADPAVVDDELVETRRRLYAPPEARAVHKLVRAADNQADVLEPKLLARIAVDVLLIHGVESHTPDTVFERALEALPAGRLVTIPDTRQWPQLERPAEVNQLVAEVAAREEVGAR